MNHCYIFDYINCKIYHTIIPDDIEDIDDYVSKKHVTSANIYTLCSEDKLEIEEL